MKLRIAIFGGSGYGGSELLRILLSHPNAEIGIVTANEHAGKAVSEVHRNLLGLTDLKFTKAPEEFESLADFDCALFALPHGQAMEIAPRLPASVKIIDLSGDFRLRDAESFAQHYGRAHTPLDANNLLSCRVIVDAKTGSSGSGAKAAANTHHPQRSNSFYAYKPFVHQHVPEIEQELKSVGDWKNELIFMTHSLPVSRGIF